MRQVVLIDRLRQPEVRDPNRGVLIKQQVGRLDVAVQRALPVGVVQSVGHLHTDPRDTLPEFVTRFR